jgi:signal transduction histidine kinase
MREIREAERNRMARELHDGVLQDLTYAAAAIEITKIKAEGTGLEEDLDRAMNDVRRSVGDLREAVYDLHAYSHQGQSTRQLLESLVELNRRRTPETKIELSVGEGFFEGLSEREGMELLRVVQEALTNARRHAGATKVHVGLRTGGDQMVAEISDDGSGFDPEGPPGVGLRSMRERARAMGGTLEVESEPGRGTRVLIRVPASGERD